MSMMLSAKWAMVATPLSRNFGLLGKKYVCIHFFVARFYYQGEFLGAKLADLHAWGEASIPLTPVDKPIISYVS